MLCNDTLPLPQPDGVHITTLCPLAERTGERLPLDASLASTLGADLLGLCPGLRPRGKIEACLKAWCFLTRLIDWNQCGCRQPNVGITN
jgi:hypothetical protein